MEGGWEARLYNNLGIFYFNWLPPGDNINSSEDSREYIKKISKWKIHFY